MRQPADRLEPPGDMDGEDERPPRRDWRETLAAAADFALLGIAVTVVSLGVLTLGGALATGSAAAAHWCRYRSMPPLRELAVTLLRALAGGAVATLVAVLGAGLLGTDVVLVARGRVPGGPVLLVLSIVVASQVAGLAGLVLVGVGERGGTGWRPAARWAVRAAFAAPLAPTALAGTLAVAVAVGTLVPVTAPVVLGFALFAIQVVARRLLPDELAALRS
ncbi:MAG TPA: hypothetical protein VJT31_30615 [Rugosimonospora sp.]|nr:hypothetical protein [Rugosimonospora sp.]